MSATYITDLQVEQLIERHVKLADELSRPMPRERFVALSKEYSDLTQVADAARKVLSMRTDAVNLRAIADDPQSDEEMKAMALAELGALHEAAPAAEHALQILLLPRDEADDRGAILEVRAGTGGDEAALFAGDLFRMYTRYAELQGWKTEVLSASESDLGGYREVIAEITGKGVYGRLKFEAGTHRVQRVPETEGAGRIHTSAATVAVLPEAEEVDMAIEDKDLRIDVYRASGAGGQHVNTTDSAVRITHVPTGLVVTCQDERSQHKNRARALKILRARLFESERERLQSERAAARKGQVGSGDRSERIRTYNFPQGRVTDHRINLTLYRLDRVMLGDLQEFSDALIAADQAERLAQLGGSEAA